jgi:glutathione S-transferase
MIQVYHSRGSCSEGILYLLHEIGAEFDLRTIVVKAGDTQAPDYKAMNPKGKVPAIDLDNGETLTEFPVIAQYLARTHPEAGLWPDDLMQQMRIMEALDYITATVHMRAFAFALVPGRFAKGAEFQAEITDYGLSEVKKTFGILSEKMGENDYLLGDFTLADTALFFVLNWAAVRGIDMPDNLAACYKRLQNRPAFAKSRPDIVTV